MNISPGYFGPPLILAILGGSKNTKGYLVQTCTKNLLVNILSPNFSGHTFLIFITFELHKKERDLDPLANPLANYQ